MFSGAGKQTLKTQRTQDNKNNRDQWPHWEKVDVSKSDKSFARLASTEICCTGHSCIRAIVKIGINAGATRNASHGAKPFSKS